MDEDDCKFMQEAIDWANDCCPTKESIPKVGAIFARDGIVLGRGRRGTGRRGDNEHAELNAINQVPNGSELAGSTLYTTLEPCTPGVRSNPSTSCTELVRQHQIKKVFVGILDPNQGVTGKGLWQLQESGVEVALFPHELSAKILAQNAAFVRLQKTLGATILSPKDGDELRTYQTAGKHTIRFQSLNPPGPDTYLLLYRGGLYWPQSGTFRPIESGVWEIDAHFGTTGEFVLQLVTANELGSALIRFYRTVVESNRQRRARLGGKVDLSLLGGDHPGIEMSGLPKGLHFEASVTVFVSYKVNLVGTFIESETIGRGEAIKITYEIESSEKAYEGIWLGASFRDDDTGKLFCNTKEDKPVSLSQGTAKYDRNFTIPSDAPLGKQLLATNIWRGPVGDSAKSKWIADGTPLQITVHDRR